MPLPKTEFALFPVTIPSTKKKVNFRRFVGKDEKILLIAKQGNEKIDMLNALRQIITNCCMDKGFDVDKLTTFDFDYIFVQLRKQSVDNVVTVVYVDVEDEEEYEVSIDLEKVVLDIPADRNKVVPITDTVKVKLKYPTIADMISISELVDQHTAEHSTEDDFEPLDVSTLLALKCVDSVFDDETVYDDYTQDELIEWLGNIPLESERQIQDFLNAIPDLTYSTTYTTKAGTVREVELRGIEDFFTL